MSPLDASPLRRAVVVVPPIRDFYATPHRLSGLGAHTVARLLTDDGVTTTMLDFPSLSTRGTPLAFPRELSHLRPFVIDGEVGRLSFFTTYRQFGPSIDECASMAADGRPEICFVACFAFCYAGETLDFATALRTARPGVTIVMGGAGVSANPRCFARAEAVDFAMTGEAEVALPPFERELRAATPEFAAVPGLWWKQDGALRAPLLNAHTAAGDLHPAWVLTRETKRSVHLTTALSRGCPRHCRFCSNHLVHGSLFRTAPLDCVAAGLERLALTDDQRAKRLLVNFEDDNLLLDPPYLLDAIAVVRRQLGAGALFAAENGIDYRLLTPELTETLIAAGMRQFNLSLGAPDPSVAAAQDRSVDLALYERLLDIMDRRGVPVITYFICGLPGDSRESIVRTLRYLAGKPTLAGLSLFYPVPGLPGFEDMARFDGVAPALCAGSSAYPWAGSLDTRSLVTAFRLSRFVNLCKQPARTPLDEELVRRVQTERRLYTAVKQAGVPVIVPVTEADERLVAAFFA